MNDPLSFESSLHKEEHEELASFYWLLTPERISLMAVLSRFELQAAPLPFL